MSKKVNDTKELFRSLGACSHTYFHLINREYGNINRIEERASDSLAGGIYQQGYQCGMLWGASLGTGAEAFKRFDSTDQAITAAINTTKHVMKSFMKRTGSIECADITDCDWSSKISMAKYFFSGKFLSCFKIAEEWTPEAIEAVEEGLSAEWPEMKNGCANCASLVAEKMGASDEEKVTVAGFAGGLGLSGNGCGALAAAIWIKNIDRCKKSDKSSYKDPEQENRMNQFLEASGYEILCSEITGEKFNTPDEHSVFINKGGCKKIIETLASF